MSSTSSASSILHIPKPTEVRKLKTHEDQYQKRGKRSLKHKIVTFLDRTVEHTTDGTVVTPLFKTLKNVFQFPAAFRIAPFAEVVAYCAVIPDTFKILATFKGIKQIKDNLGKKDEKPGDGHLRRLGIADGIFRVLIGGGAFTKLLDLFGALKIAEITAAMGRSSVAGSVLAKIFPFAVVTGLLEVGHNVSSVGIAAIRIHRNRQDKKNIKKKMTAFNLNSLKVGNYIQEQLDKIKEKQTNALSEFNALDDKVRDTKVKIEEAEIKFDKLLKKKEAIKNSSTIARFFKKLSFIPRYKLQKGHVFAAKRRHDKVCGDRTDLHNKYTKWEKKIPAWNHLKNDFEKEGVKEGSRLEKAVIGKHRKWTVEKSNLTVKNRQEGVGIAINILSSITLIANAALLLSGIGTLPAVLTISSAFLLVSLLSLGNDIYKKWKRPKHAPSVNIIQLTTTASRT